MLNSNKITYRPSNVEVSCQRTTFFINSSPYTGISQTAPYQLASALHRKDFLSTNFVIEVHGPKQFLSTISFSQAYLKRFFINSFHYTGILQLVLYLITSRTVLYKRIPLHRITQSRRLFSILSYTLQHRYASNGSLSTSTSTFYSVGKIVWYHTNYKITNQ